MEMSRQKPFAVHVRVDEPLRPVDLILLQTMRGGPTRLEILNVLDGGDKTCNEISGRIRVSWGAVYQHLMKMRDAGLVAETRVGRICYYRATSWGEKAARALGNGHDIALG